MTNLKKIIIVLTVLLLVFLSYGAYFAYNIYHFSATISAPTDSVEEHEPRELPKAQPKQNLNILVVGVDSGKFKNTDRGDLGRTDTIMLFSINRDSKKVSLLSVPRDTYVEIQGRGQDKVNHAYAFGGMDLSIKTISQFLGVPIHHYVRVDYEAFVKIVDGLGGVTLDVTEDVVFFGDGKTKVTKGTHKMDGAMAFEYVQTRQGDIARVERQQKFVKTFADQSLTLGNIPKIPNILNGIASDIKTDLSPKEMMDLAMELRSMNLGNMTNKIVPGKAAMIKGVSYWIPDEAGTKQIVQALFN